MKIEDQTITRIYKCGKCEAQVSFEEKVCQPWRKKCPLCNKHSLVIESANYSITTMVDVKNPRTLGAISDQNLTRKDKEGLLDKKKTPFWRKDRKINYNVLKNPKKYIETGAT